MAYSDDDVRNFYLDIDRITGRDNIVTSLEELKKRLRKEVNFQDECEGGNSLGNLLLKHAAEEDNSRVKDFLLQNGCEPPQQEQITAAINEEEEVPNVEENKTDSNKVDSSNCKNPGMTAEVLYGQLIQGKETNPAIFDSFANAVRESNITGDRSVFLDVVKLFTDLDAVIHLTDTASRTILDIAAITKQADVVRILLDSGKFNEEEKFNALRSAIVQGNVQEFEVFLDYIDHAKILEALNKASCNENTDIMKVLLNNKRFTGEEKVQVLIGTAIDDDLPKVRLLLKYMTGIPEDGIRNLLKIIEERKLSLGEELKIDSEFKVDFNNSDHCKYLSNYVIIAILRSAINKKQNTLNVEENGAGLSGSNITTLNDGDIRNLCLDIDRVTKQDSTVTSFEDLQKRLKRKGINLQSKCEKNAVLEYAIKDQNLNVIKFLLQNEVTIINAISQEGRYYVSKIEEDKSILCSVVSYTNDSNAEILGMLLQNINAEQSKLNPGSELYRLYQQLKDDAFCTAVAENNSVAATVLIQNDQERIAPRKSAVNKDETPVVTAPTIVTRKTNTTAPSVEENKTGLSNSNKNVGNKPMATVFPVSTNVSTRTDQATPNNGNKANGFVDAQFSMPNEKETKYKENFHNSLKKDAVGVVVTGLFIAAAVMVPFVAGAVVCGIVAALVAIVTGWHIKSSTLPSYREMEENKVEHVQKTAKTL